MDIIKSKTDKRQYKHVTLDNGLKVLLVHDDDSDMSTCAMAVNAGFYVDPKDSQGLAHFLEHMLFMGTEKYPGEDYYHTFVSHHGGYTNAYTFNEETVFYFSIQQQYFKETLDIFASYFVSPLLKEDGIDREMNAVDSEHQKNVLSDSWRENAVISAISNKDYPLSNFGTGNLKTLKKEEVKDTKKILRDFYDKYYSSNTMRLVMYGKQSLDELEKYARDMFSEIPNKKKEPISYQGVAFNMKDSNKYHKYVELVPVKNKNKLTIHWQVPSTRKLYKIDPLGYISHYLGHEGEGSIYYVLRELGWCDALYTYESHTDKNISIITLDIELTEKGFNNYTKVLKLIDDYVEMLRKKGIRENRYDELRKEKQLRFHYKNKSDPIRYVEKLVSNYLHYPVQDVLSISQLVQPYDNSVGQVLQNYVNLLNNGNAILILSSKRFEGKTSEIEKWYKINYNVESNKHIDLPKGEFNIHLPGKNPFIPKSLEMVKEDNHQYPVKLDSEFNIWYKTNTTFNIPHAHLSLYLYLPKLYKDITHHEQNILFIECVNDALNPVLYYADLMNINSALYFTEGWLNISVSGFNDNVPKVLSLYLKSIMQFNTNQHKFDTVKTGYLTKLKNIKYEQPYSHINEFYLEKYDKKYVGNYLKRIEAVNETNLNKILKVPDWLFEGTNIKCLYEGNVTEKDVREIEMLIKSTGLGSMKVKQSNNIDALNKNRDRLTKNVLNKDETNSAIGYYVDIGHIHMDDKDWADKNALLMLLHHIIKTPFFDKLRTDEQLGYIVSSKIFNNDIPENPLCGYKFIIQSPVKEPKYLEERIDDFIKNFRKKINELAETDFRKHIKIIIKNLTKKDNNLGESFGRSNNILFKGSDKFNYRKMLVSALKEITLDDLITFYNRYFINDTKIRVVGALRNKKKMKIQ